jgi:hypothetical protein
MEPSRFVLETAMAVASHFAQKGAEITFEKAKDLIRSICQEDPALAGQVNIDELAKKIQATAGHVGRVAYNEETLARFLEIPLPDLADITPDNLNSRMLYDHVKLEGEFQEWLEEWGYDVQLGCPLSGLRGITYVPDVYGQLTTLHGSFEICVNFVCDSPPDEDRVFALLGKIEAYAEAKRSFSSGDIFAIVTPHRFTQGSINAISLQNEQEAYSVFPLEGGDIYVLENAQCAKDRLQELQDKVRQAEEEFRTSKLSRGAHEE